MSYRVSTPLGTFVVHRSLELAARLALALGGTVAPTLDVPPAPVRVGVRAA